jgi:hypothetical protein
MSSGWARIAETESRTSQYRSSAHDGIVYALPDKSIVDIIRGALLIAEIPLPARIARTIRWPVHPLRS